MARRFTLTPKQNLLNALQHKKTEWVPMYGEDVVTPGFQGTLFEMGPYGGGYDGFGVLWENPESGGGQPVAAPNSAVLDDICDWREVVRWPDVEGYHWEEDAHELFRDAEPGELDDFGNPRPLHFDRENLVVDYQDANGPFDRLEMLMGFENALIALLEEPEACKDFFHAFTEYKLACLRKVVEFYKPDIITLYDDVCTQRSPFMSKSTYQELISPVHKELVDYVKSQGIIPVLHCCGFAEILVDDFIAEGFAGWTSVQPCNDVRKLHGMYGDKLCFIGGWDSNGEPGSTNDVAVIDAEIERCMREYGDLESYIFFGYGLLPMSKCESVWDVWRPTQIINEHFAAYTREHAEELRPSC